MPNQYEDLIKFDLEQKQNNINAQKAKLAKAQNQPKAPDLSALMMAADMFSGSNLTSQYQKMRPKDNTVKNQALQQQLMQQEQGLIGSKLALLKLAESRKKQQTKSNLSLTPGEKSRDQAFAQEASDWDSSGGYANFAGNLDRLKAASNELGKDGDLSNTIMPKMIRDVIDPESSKLQEDVEFVAQQSLKQILGGQFSEKEGENLIRRTYNPRLPDEVNQRKLDTLIKQMDTQARAKDRAMKYFNKNGTLKGFEGSSATTLSGFEKEMKKEILDSVEPGDKKSRLEELRKKAGF